MKINNPNSSFRLDRYVVAGVVSLFLTYSILNYDNFLNKSNESHQISLSNYNELLSSGELSDLINNIPSNEITSDLYVSMFNHIKDKAEERPKIMDYFGENAQNYMKEKYSNSNSLTDVKNAKKYIIDLFGD